MPKDWHEFTVSTSKLATKSVPYLGVLCFVATVLTSFTGSLVVVVAAAVPFLILAGLTVALPLSLIWLPKEQRGSYLKSLAICVVSLIATVNAPLLTNPIHDSEFHQQFTKYQLAANAIKEDLTTGASEHEQKVPADLLPPGVSSVLPSRTSDGGTLIEFLHPAWHHEGYLYCSTDPRLAVTERSQMLTLTRVAPNWYRFSD